MTGGGGVGDDSWGRTYQMSSFSTDLLMTLRYMTTTKFVMTFIYLCPTNTIPLSVSSVFLVLLFMPEAFPFFLENNTTEDPSCTHSYWDDKKLLFLDTGQSDDR